MSSARILFGLLCIAIAGCTGLPDRGAIADGQPGKGASLEGISKDTAGEDPQVQGNQRLAAAMARRVVKAAQAEIGVREWTENSGERVDVYNEYTGVRKAPWCASFVSYCFYTAGFGKPRTAWSPALFPVLRRVEGFATSSGRGAGLVLGIYYASKGRIAHCGIVERIEGDWCYSIEGNTNSDGGREGDGVYAKRRHLRTIYRFANWLDPVDHPKGKGGAQVKRAPSLEWVLVFGLIFILIGALVWKKLVNFFGSW